MNLQVIATTIFGTIVYFMATFSLTPGRYFFFIWALISFELALNAIFRFAAYSSKSLAAANALSGAGTGVLLLFGMFSGCDGSFVIMLLSTSASLHFHHYICRRLRYNTKKHA